MAGAKHRAQLSKGRDRHRTALSRPPRAFEVQETRIAAALEPVAEVTRVRGSGNGNRKGDLLVGQRLQLEAKVTERASVGLKREDLLKAARQAREAGRVSVLVVGFAAVPPGEVADYAVVPLPLFRDLLALAGGDLPRG